MNATLGMASFEKKNFNCILDVHPRKQEFDTWSLHLQIDSHQ